MKKSEVQTHNDGGIGGPYHPAVNVKVRRTDFTTDDIIKAFKCDQGIVERAGQFAWDSACQQFWDQVEGMAQDILKDTRVKVYQAGRGGGWAVVEGLPDVEGWNAVMLSRWRKFEKACHAEVGYRMSWAQVKEDIDANNWYQEGAEAYNFHDDKAGKTVCISELKAKARAAGFGPVIRK